MAFSYNEVVAGTGQTLVTLTFPFLDRTHVKVSVDRVDLPGSAWVWVSDASVELNEPLIGGETLRVYRETPAEGVQADFQPGAFDYQELNTSLLHLLYIVQEAYDNASVAVEAGNNAFAYLMQIEELADDAEAIFADMQALGVVFDDTVTAALVAVEASRTTALSDIGTARSGALDAIATSRASALSALGSQQTTSVTAVTDAQAAATTAINALISTATTLRDQAEAAKNAAAISAANALASENNVALAGVHAGSIKMRFGPLDPGYIAWGEGGTFNRATYPALATWLDNNGAALGLTAPQIAAGTIPDWRDYSPRTAGGSLGPAVGVKQEDAFQGHQRRIATMSTTAGAAYATASAGALVNATDNSLFSSLNLQTSGYFTDGISGTPRTASETRVKSFGVRWQIKAFGIAVDPGSISIVSLSSQVATLAQQVMRKDTDWSAGLTVPERVTILNNILQAWEQIGPDVIASGASQVAWTDLQFFRFLRCRWYLIATGNTGGLVANASTTNGASWQQGAADYRYQGKVLTNGVQSYLVPTDAPQMPMAGAVYGSNFASGYIEFHGWNVANAISPGQVKANLQSAGGWSVSEIDLITLFPGIKNAFRIYPIGGTLSGTFVLEGIRG